MLLHIVFALQQTWIHKRHTPTPRHLKTFVFFKFSVRAIEAKCSGLDFRFDVMIAWRLEFWGVLFMIGCEWLAQTMVAVYWPHDDVHTYFSKCFRCEYYIWRRSSIIACRYFRLFGSRVFQLGFNFVSFSFAIFCCLDFHLAICSLLLFAMFVVIVVEFFSLCSLFVVCFYPKLSQFSHQ